MAPEVQARRAPDIRRWGLFALNDDQSNRTQMSDASSVCRFTRTGRQTFAGLLGEEYQGDIQGRSDNCGAVLESTRTASEATGREWRKGRLGRAPRGRRTT